MSTPINTPEMRAKCAQALTSGKSSISQMSAFVGLDGFIDEIIHVVDKRANVDSFQRVPTIARLAERLAGAAGQSTNIELVTQRIKLGGNGPIMANALASFDIKVTYVGALGYPTLHPVFQDLAHRAEVVSIAEAAHTDALEFEDGKLMLGKMTPLNDLTWQNLMDRCGRKKFTDKFSGSNLLAFVNWTMIPYMSDLWDSMLIELCPNLNGPKRRIFFDLADPAKRTNTDILRALKLIEKFQKYFDVILGLNEKEALAIGEVLGLKAAQGNPQELAALALGIQKGVPIETLAIHPVTYALAASNGVVSVVQGPYIPKPLITTGAGDHFNAGFCLGKLIGLENSLSVLTGVATSGFYVQNAKTPTVDDLIGFLGNWPQRS